MTPDVPPLLARQAWRQLELDLPPGTLMVFDGKKIAYSTSEMGESTFKVLIDKNEQITIPALEVVQRGGGDRGRGRGGNKLD
jgi:hypothetical protein